MDPKHERDAQNLAFFLGLILFLSMLATPYAISEGVQAVNNAASAKTTKELAHLSTANIAQATYVFYNTTGALVKVDVTSQLNTSIIDVANANGAGFPGLQVDSILLSGVGFGGANETDPLRPSYLEFRLNQTGVERFLDAPLTSVAYTLRPIVSGQYTPNTVNATSKDYHTSTSPDFGVRVAFAQGEVSLVAHGGLTLSEGTSTGGNYTRKASVEGVRLIKADYEGKTYLDAYDNPVVVRIEGYKAGRNGNLGDSVRFSVQFQTPDSNGAWSYYEGYALGFALSAAVSGISGALASPYFVFRKGFPFIGKTAPPARTRARRG